MKAILASITLLTAALAALAAPAVAADDHCPPPGMPSPDPVDAVAQTARSVARAACQTAGDVCEAAGEEAETCWIRPE